MSFQKWMDLYKKIEELEEKIIKGREEWMQQGIGSGFSYYLYQKRVEQYRKEGSNLLTVEENKREDKFQEELLEMVIKRLKDIRTQGMINRDDFPEKKEVAEQAEKIIQEAECLLDYCNSI